MRIVQVLPGITKFLAQKGDHGIEKDIDINTIPGIPFEVPDELAQARLKASSNLYRKATPEDDEYAKNYKEEKKQELDQTIQVPDFISKPAEATTEEFDANKFLSEIEPTEEFDANKFLSEIEPTEEILVKLERSELLAVGRELELEFPANIPSAKLINLILDKTK